MVGPRRATPPPLRAAQTLERERLTALQKAEEAPVPPAVVEEAEPSLQAVVPPPLLAARELERARLTELDRLAREPSLLEVDISLETAFPVLFELYPGFPPLEIDDTEQLVSNLFDNFTTDPEGFLFDLETRGTQEQQDFVLRLLGVPVSGLLQRRKTEQETANLVSGLFPDMTELSEVADFANAKPDEFAARLRLQGFIPETVELLKLFDLSPHEIAEFFATSTRLVEVDGLQQLLTITPNGQAFDISGVWVGTYNNFTHEYTSMAPESWFKDTISDPFVTSIRGMVNATAQFWLATVPDILFRPQTEKERRINGDALSVIIDENNQTLRDEWRGIAADIQQGHDALLIKNPQLQPKPEWREGHIVSHPGFFTQTAELMSYSLWLFSNSLPYTLASVGTYSGLLLTTGNPVLAATGTVAVLTPVLTQEVKTELVLAGMAEADASALSIPVGVILSTLELVGDMPFFKALFPRAWGSIRQAYTRELGALLRGVKTGGAIITSEVLTENAQQALINLTVKLKDRDREIFGDIREVTTQTILAMLPLAALGGGVTMVRASPAASAALSDFQKNQRGWLRDPTQDWWMPELAENATAEQRASFELANELLDDALPGTEQFAEVPEVVVAEAAPLTAALEEDAELLLAKAKEQVPGDALTVEFETALENVRAAAPEAKRQALIQVESLETGIRELIGEPAIVPEAAVPTPVPPEALPVTPEPAAPALTPEENEQVVAVFGNLLADPSRRNFEKAQELLRTEELSKRAAQLKPLTRQFVEQGFSIEEALKKSEEALTGALPSVQTFIPQLIDQVFRPALFAKIDAEVSGFERAATRKALENALAGKPIPSKPGAKGGSALSRLRAVFPKEIIDAFQGPGGLEAFLLENLPQPVGVSDAALRDYLRGLPPSEQGVLGFDQPVTPRLGDSPWTPPPSPRDPRPLSQRILDFTRLRRAAGLLPKGVTQRPEFPPADILRREQRAQPELGEPRFVPPALKEKLTLAERRQRDLELRLELGKKPTGIEGERPSFPPSDQALREIQGQQRLDEPAWIPPDPLVTMTEAERIAQVIDIRNAMGQVPRGVPGGPPQFPPGQARELALFPSEDRARLWKLAKDSGMTIIDFFNFIRAVRASVDLSAWRQMSPLIFGNFTEFLVANPEMFKAAWSADHAKAVNASIERTEEFVIYDKLNLDFLRPFDAAAVEAWKRTEEFIIQGRESVFGKLADKMPFIRISARAHITFTNKMSFDIWRKDIRNLGGVQAVLADPKLLETIKKSGQMLADMTGRGPLGPFKGAAPVINALFFAPRFTVGRLVAPRWLVSGNPYVRKQAWKNFLASVLGFGSIMALGVALGLWSVEDDQRNPDFAKVRVGNTRIDPWGGNQQIVVLFARLISGEQISSTTGMQRSVDLLDTLQHWSRGKASPLSQWLLDATTGKTFLGEPVDLADPKQWMDRVAPFALLDIYEAFEEEGLAGLLWAAAPAIFGANVASYGSDYFEQFRDKLGLPVQEGDPVPEVNGKPVTIEEQPFYTMATYFGDINRRIMGVPTEEVTAENFPPEWVHAAETRDDRTTMNGLSNAKPVNLNTDPAQGNSLDEFKLQGDLIAQESDAELKAALRLQFPNAITGITRDNLIEYHIIKQTGTQAQLDAFEEEHPELFKVPRREWLIANPTQNANLALWGHAPLASQETVTLFEELVERLDISEDWLPRQTLPPVSSLDTHFDYLELVADGKAAGSEAKLLILKDFLDAQQSGNVGYAAWRSEQGNPLTVTDNSLEYWTLRVDNLDLFEEFDKVVADETLDDVVKDEDGLTERDRAIAAIRDTVVGDLTFHDIERIVDFRAANGTRDNPVPSGVITDFTSRLQVADEFGSSTHETTQFDMKQDAFYQWQVDNVEDFTDRRAEWTPRFRQYIDLKVKWGEEDDLWDAFVDADSPNFIANETRRAEAREDLEATGGYGEARHLMDMLTDKDIPDGLVAAAVDYRIQADTSLPRVGDFSEFRLDRMLIEIEGLSEALDLDVPDFAPPVRYDELREQWHPQLVEFDAIDEGGKRVWILQPQQRDFLKATLEMDAYMLRFTEQADLTVYVDYMLKSEYDGRPADWPEGDTYWEPVWVLKDNLAFFQRLRTIRRQQQKDAGKRVTWGDGLQKNIAQVPTREVWQLRLEYLDIPARNPKARDFFRHQLVERGEHGLEDYLVNVIGLVPIEKKNIFVPTPDPFEEIQETLKDLLEALR